MTPCRAGSHASFLSITGLDLITDMDRCQQRAPCVVTPCALQPFQPSALGCSPGPFALEARSTWCLLQARLSQPSTASAAATRLREQKTLLRNCSLKHCETVSNALQKRGQHFSWLLSTSSNISAVCAEACACVCAGGTKLRVHEHSTVHKPVLSAHACEYPPAWQLCLLLAQSNPARWKDKFFLSTHASRPMAVRQY